jgi:hypothetical protein
MNDALIYKWYYLQQQPFSSSNVDSTKSTAW